uniref:C-type lectin domain-containing protein n=1 Tax=Wuchereria bancrofti TaxID=6293 RepID=A0A1I8EDX2_WUCBA
MCSSKFPWISARIPFLKVNQIHIKHIPILIGLIHMRGMGFIWTTGNNGSYLNLWDSSYNSLYDEMPFWIDPTFHPYLNTTEIHCHRFVIWTHTNDNYARAIPCEYPTNNKIMLKNESKQANRKK